MAQPLRIPSRCYPFGETGAALHMLGAVAPGLGVCGVKVRTQIGANAQPQLLIFDSATAPPVPLIDAYALSSLRTGVLAAVATYALAHPEASILGVVGSGKQARALVAAIARVRRLSEVRLWSPTADNRTRAAAELSEALGLIVRAVKTPAGVVRDADIVSLPARAPEPPITSGMLARRASHRDRGYRSRPSRTAARRVPPLRGGLCRYP
ncbi:hypothetical protein GI374_15010 [Paracoccus sp. S-4012]|uniref:hypothetical protein n=1 Tax=Paracoccus sp. S-4012 TaxID=2665648 RepID=UPI0012B0A6AA|nr:hypothetical protein [Paracoccus sp. S-4012]MRX51712.1 hypothetical protein [Paracoccus sp. S-4012]